MEAAVALQVVHRQSHYRPRLLRIQAEAAGLGGPV